MKRRFVYRKNEAGEVESFEVGTDYQRHEGRAPLYTDLYMDGHVAIDGTDIGSRAKRRAYMTERGLADASDFTNTWARARAEREAIRNGTHNDGGQIRAALQRAWEGRKP